MVPRRLLSLLRNSLVSCRPNYSNSSSKLTIRGELTKLPLSISDFKKIREPGVVYYDKTSHIAKLEEGADAQLLCRPRRFGKSLTITMLRYFHGVQFLGDYDNLFGGLDVVKDVLENIVRPGQYLILEFDFSPVPRFPEVRKASKLLADVINHGLARFMHNYSKHLGDQFTSDVSALDQDNPVGNIIRLVGEVDFALQEIHSSGDRGHPFWDVKGIYLLADEYDAYANEYMDPYNPKLWTNTEPFQLLKGIWSSVKSARKLARGIRKTYITGATPLLLGDIGSGANDHENISFSPEMSTICGLTCHDVLQTLESICHDREEAQIHLRSLEHQTNGYHFCRRESVQPVFNTKTALSYIQAIKQGYHPDINNISTSEVPERVLQACARAPTAVEDMQLALQKDERGAWQKIPCRSLLCSLTHAQLNIESTGDRDRSAWQSFMVYMGGLTPDADNPSRFLRIPNLVAAERIGSAILDRYGLRDSMQDALNDLAETGNPTSVLAGYCRLMRQRDVKGSSLVKSEEQHRDSIFFTLLENPSLTPTVKYEVKKQSFGQGFIDLVITDNKNHYSIIEFKSIPVRYLDLNGATDKDKADNLASMGLHAILSLEFKGSKYHSGTIRNWIDGNETAGDKLKVHAQLQSYIRGPTIQKEIVGKRFRGWIAVIVGARHIIIREMDSHGQWVGGFLLA